MCRCAADELRCPACVGSRVELAQPPLPGMPLPRASHLSVRGRDDGAAARYRRVLRARWELFVIDPDDDPRPEPGSEYAQALDDFERAMRQRQLGRHAADEADRYRWHAAAAEHLAPSHADTDTADPAPWAALIGSTLDPDPPPTPRLVDTLVAAPTAPPATAGVAA